MRFLIFLLLDFDIFVHIVVLKKVNYILDFSFEQDY